MKQRFFPPFDVGTNVSNKEIMDAFRCGNAGGIRYSTATRTIVLISNHNFHVYDNRPSEEGGTFYFTGEGQEGDQRMDRGNRRLRDAAINGIEIHLFESFADEPGYRYQGVAEVIGAPSVERQADKNGNTRNVFMFKLKRGDG